MRGAMEQTTSSVSDKWPLWRLASVSFVAAISLAVIGVALDPGLASETFRIALQFLLIVVFGGVLSQVFKEQEIKRTDSARLLENERDVIMLF